MKALRLENITHAYDGLRVLDDVSLAVEAGEVVCLLGPSGCGKTTLLRLAAGLERIQMGRILVGDRIVAEADAHLHEPPENRGAGLMFQDYALFPHLTIDENIRFGLNGHASFRSQWLRDAMSRMGIVPLSDSYPHTLSGGQQQRAALLRALAPNPEILLLDEPFSDLDVNRRIQVRDATHELLREAGAATLIVTHDPEEAMFMADRILVMEKGHIVQSGSPMDTYFRPASGFVAELFGPVNRLHGRVANGTVETPLGSFRTTLPEGSAAEIMIRLEGFRTAGDGDERAGGRIDARILSARPLGRTTYVRFSVRGIDGSDLSLQARIPGGHLPETGSTLALEIDPKQAFVFPA
ncbi:MAG: ABC transporter ATP-binding protein [Rhodospirillales bacterium]|nr:ABC transporter ATP-binding protein [Rhodospirillales bacterium]